MKLCKGISDLLSLLYFNIYSFLFILLIEVNMKSKYSFNIKGIKTIEVFIIAGVFFEVLKAKFKKVSECFKVFQFLQNFKFSELCWSQIFFSAY